MVPEMVKKVRTSVLCHLVHLLTDWQPFSPCKEKEGEGGEAKEQGQGKGIDTDDRASAQAVVFPGSRYVGNGRCQAARAVAVMVRTCTQGGVGEWTWTI